MFPRSAVWVLGAVILSALALTHVRAQDAWYQDKSGPIPLWYSTQRVVIKFGMPTAELASFQSRYWQFDPTIPIELAPYSFHEFYLVPGVNVSALLSDLEADPDVDIANPVYRTADSVEGVPNDRVSMKFASDLSRNQIDSLNLLNGVTIVDSVWADSNWFVVQVTALTGQSVLEIANTYEQYGNVDFAIPDFWVPVELASVPPDSFFVHQWNYHNTGQSGGLVDADIDALEAWDFGLGDSTLVIANIDTGVEGHEDLPSARLVGGYDFAGFDATIDTLGDADPRPGSCCLCAHGMSTAGLISASQNGLGIAGLAPNTKILPIKIFDDRTAKGTTITNIAKALVYPWLHGASISSNSWSYHVPDTLNPLLKSVRYAVKLVTSAGMLVICSAGNNGLYVDFPSNMAETISVGATDKLDQHLYYSPYITFADSLDMVAPSGPLLPDGDIWTLDIAAGAGWDQCYTVDPPANNSYITRFSGTSAACPQVTGVAALVMSYERRSSFRDLTLEDIKAVLKKSTDDLGPIGWDSLYGYGRLNALKSLVAIARGDTNRDGSISAADIIAVTNHVFKGIPLDMPALGDANCDGVTTSADVIYLTGYVFRGGPTTPLCYEYDY